jgi:drug/metabolite transporter (DMT)-like permease
MLKAFTPVSVLLLSFIGGLENPSYLQLMIVFMISAGVTLSAVGELRFSFFGFFLQLAGILSESLRLVLADRFLKDLKLDALSTLYYIAPPSFTIITIGFFIFEFNQFPLERLCSSFAGILLINGIASFTLNVRQSQDQSQRHAFLSLQVPS